MDARWNILVVDDDQDALRLCARYLDDPEYHVVTAPNGHVALNLFDKELFHLVLTDMMMPGLDGLALMREVRKTGLVLSTPEGSLAELTVRMQGAHQHGNALVALGVLHQLRRQGFLIPDDAIRKSLASVQVPGRLETLLPGLVIDGAHNEDGAKALAAWLSTRPRPSSRILLWGMSSGRDPLKIIAPLLPLVDEVVTTRCAHPRARPSYELAAMMQELDVLLADGGPIEHCLPEVYREAHETIVSGSLFLAGAARSMVREGRLAGIEPGQGPPEDAVDEDADGDEEAEP